MTVLRAIAIATVGVIAGICIVALGGILDVAPFGRPGANPGLLDRGSRSGAEIRLEPNANGACTIADKTRTIRAKTRYRVVWNVHNDCRNAAQVELAFGSQWTADTLTVSVPARVDDEPGVATIAATVEVRLNPGEDQRHFPYTVRVDGSTVDPDLIIDRY